MGEAHGAERAKKKEGKEERGTKRMRNEEGERREGKYRKMG